MNRIFRIVWSAARGAPVVLSELPARRKCRPQTLSRAALMIGQSILLSAAPIPAFAYSAANGTDCANQGDADTRIAIGTESRACATSSVAIGENASIGDEASGNAIGSVAIGLDTQAYGVGIAIGRGAIADQQGAPEGEGSIAIGYEATTAPNSLSALALGRAASASNNNSVALGRGATADADRATAIGNNANATGADAVSIGTDAQVTAAGGVAIGRNTRAASSTALGGGARATGVNSLAIGTRTGFITIASGDGAIALGNLSESSAQTSIALGRQSVASSSGAIAQGQGANASGLGAIALGGGTNGFDSTDITQASGDRSIAVGNQATSSGADTVAFGTGAVASGNGDIAIGVNSTVDGGGLSALAIGRQANAAGSDAGAFGNSADASADFSLAMGNFSAAGAENSVAVGNSAAAAGVASSAFGNFANAQGANATAIGSGGSPGNFEGLGAQALADGATAIGGNSERGAIANATNSIAIGGESTSSGEDALALGTGAVASGAQSLSIGTGNQVSGASAVAIGNNASATNADTLAAGTDSTAGGSASIAMGRQAESSADNALAIGNMASSSSNNSVALGIRANIAENAAGSVAIGDTASATQSSAIAMGIRATASGQEGMALGFESQASGASSLALGPQSEASGNQSISIGDNAVASGTQSLSIGTGNTVSGNNAGAIGDPTTVSGDNAYSLGNDNTISGNNAFTIGNDNNVAADNAGVFGSNNFLSESATGSRVIGNNAGTSDTPIDVADAFIIGNDASVTRANSVALGSNSVADGATLGDAPFQPTDADGNAIAVSGTNPVGEVSVGDGGSERRISSVAAGSTDTDAVNVSQLDAVNQNVTANRGDITNLQGGFTLQADGTQAGQVQAGDSVNLSNQDGNLSIAAGADDEVQFNLADDVTIGSSLAITSGPTINGDGINMNGGTITNLGDPINAGDAVNKSYADSVSGDLVAQGLNFSGNVGDEVHQDLGQTLAITGEATSAGNYSGANLQTTTDPTTGAIGIQMTDQPQFGDITLNDGGSGRIAGVTAGVDDTDAVNVSQLNDVSNVANQGWNLSAQDGSAANVAPGSGVNLRNADGNVEVSRVTNNGREEITFDLADEVTIGSSLAVTNGPTLNGDGIDMNGDTITSLADGAVSADSSEAVNGSQLFATNQNVDQNSSDIATNAGDITTNANDIATNTGDISTLQGGFTLQADDTQAGQVQAGDSVNLSNQDGNLSIAAGADDEVQFNLADDVTIGNSLAITSGPTLNGNGIDMNGDIITNLADPINAGDAVNLEYFNRNRVHYYSVNDGGTIGNNYDNDGAMGLNSLAAGVNAASSGERSVALGSGTLASAVDGVALGSGAIADRAGIAQQGRIDTIGDAFIRYNTTDQNILGAVSVGNAGTGNDDASYRQITNVADGIQSQDAVTLRQLRGAVGSVEQTSTFYFHANSPVADGQDDALAIGENSVAIGPNTTVNADSGIGMGNGARVETTAPGATAIGQRAYVSQADSLALGTRSRATAEQAIALGTGAEASRPQSVALGSNSVTEEVIATEGITLQGNRYDFAGIDPSGTVSIGGTKVDDDGNTLSQTRTLTNLAAGRVSADSTDGINGSQLYTTNQALASVGDRVNEVAGNTNDAYVEANGRGIRYARTNESGLTPDDAFAQGRASTALGYRAQATAENAVALGRDARATEEGSVAIGANAITSDALATSRGNIAGQIYTYAGANPVGTVSIGSAGNERTLTNLAAGRVSAQSTDAVNGSQLYATNQAVESVQGEVNQAQGDIAQLDGRVTNIEGNVTSLGNDIDRLGDSTVQYATNEDGSIDRSTVELTGDGGTTITNVADGSVAEGSRDAVNGNQLWQVQNEIANISGGDIRYFSANSEAAAALANGAESVAMGPRSVADGESSVALGNGATATSDGGVAIGAGSQAARDGMNGGEERFSGTSVASARGAVSVGSEGGERQITHVAGGTQATDAVNVRQLGAVQAGAVNYDRNDDGSVNYGSVTMGREDTPTRIHNVAAGEADTDAANVGQLRALDRNYRQQIGGLYSRIDDVEDQANAGTASALAAAAVPQATLPGKSMVAAGGGTYQGQSAVSVGLSRLSDNGRWTTKLNLTGDTQNNFGAGVGIGFHW